MDDMMQPEMLTDAAQHVRRQRAVVVTLAKARRFDEMPAAHQVLRQMEDTLKLERAGRPALD